MIGANFWRRAAVCAVFAWTQTGFAEPEQPAFTHLGGCSHDTRSGLDWELKTHDGGLRDRRWSFTPYRAHWKAAGIVGYRDTVSGRCDRKRMPGGSCNIDAYVEAVNQSRLCGHNDWRLPSVAELIEVTTNSRDLVDPRLLPAPMPGWYWTGTESGGGMNYPRVILLPPGGSPRLFDGSYYLWLVRGTHVETK